MIKQRVMLCNGFLLTLELAPVSRLQVLAVTGLIAALAIIGIALADLPSLQRFGLGFCVLGLLLLTRVPQVDYIVWPVDQLCCLVMCNGEKCFARLSSAWVIGGVAGLLWRTETGRRVPVWFVRTQLSSRGWRQLSVRLRFSDHGGA
jgi:hypothetical protein